MSETTAEVQAEPEAPVLDLTAIRIAAKTFQSQAAAVERLHDELTETPGLATGLWTAYSAYGRIVRDTDAVLRGIDALEASQAPVAEANAEGDN